MRTTTISTQRRFRALGVCWLALGVPVGFLVGWFVQISDNPQDRHFGWYLLALGILALVLGLILVRKSGPRLRVTSLGASCLWVLASGVAVVLADFPSDRMWGAGLTGLVAVVTGATALVARP